MQTVTLSESAVAVLRFEIKGWKSRKPGARLAEYRELAEAGIMEPVPGTEAEYRFTEHGYAHRQEILEREYDRIERGRFEPPDTSRLSKAAMALLRRIVSSERIEITAENRPAFRELAEARIIYLMNTFAGGAESGYRFTLLGWEQRFEILACAKGNA